jgi:quinol monooxygenase YgiN
LITVLFRVKAKPGKEDEAMAAFTTMVQNVESKETGAAAYVLHRLADDPSTFVFYEAYNDDEAFKTHMSTEHMAAMQARFAELFDTSTVKMERVERLAGFTR